MIATDDALYMGDHESCKVIDARTGEIRREIKIDAALTDGPVWKWMALQGDVLYALVGNPEVTVETLPSLNRGLGHWPWGMWKGHDYADPRTAFGFGRTLVAVDRNTGKLLWHYRDDEFLDARAVCMSNDRLYCMSPGKFLLCVSANRRTAAVAQPGATICWRRSGPNERAQHFMTGYATTCYMKCKRRLLVLRRPAAEADGRRVHQGRQAASGRTTSAICSSCCATMRFTPPVRSRRPASGSTTPRATCCRRCPAAAPARGRPAASTASSTARRKARCAS